MVSIVLREVFSYSMRCWKLFFVILHVSFCYFLLASNTPDRSLSSSFRQDSLPLFYNDIMPGTHSYVPPKQQHYLVKTNNYSSMSIISLVVARSTNILRSYQSQEEYIRRWCFNNSYFLSTYLYLTSTPSYSGSPSRS